MLELPVGVVEDLRRESVRPQRSPEAFSAQFQICLPYRGLFVWYVGDEEVVGDANQIVFVRGGEPFRMSAPTPQGYAELIITPDRDVLAELAWLDGQSLFDHPLFARRTWRARPSLQAHRTRFLHWARSSTRDSLEAEEAVLALLRGALQQEGWRDKPAGATTARLIRRAKEFLEANLSRRLLLADVARAAGASPAYLTDLFTRVEGLSLHQYLMHLRLGRALIELPHASDLTALALDLGFSSHSHFTFAFRRSFGSTPSVFRKRTRAEAHPTGDALRSAGHRLLPPAECEGRSPSS